ncbi:hypothetical protein BsWGS_10599 [Bradybaena similaris]
MVLSREERIFLVEQVFRNGGRYTRVVVQRFIARFPDKQPPHRITVRNLLNKFIATGNVEDAPRSGRPVVNDEICLDIQDRILKSPDKSLRKLSQQVSLPLSRLHKVLKQRLHFHPYRISVVHELKERDNQSRVNYCTWFQAFLAEEGESILDVTFFSDEAWFHLSGYVNSQNNRIWSSFNPNAFYAAPVHDAKIGVWCAVSRRRIIGPIFFNNTINAHRYVTEILEPFLEQLNEREIEEAWFQQDGATAHTARASLRFLEEIFSNRIISKGIWPARSPELTPLDYYLWGFLKGNVYKTNVHTIEELKEAIRNAIQEITTDTLSKVFDNMKRRVQTCLEARGGHFQHLL